MKFPSRRARVALFAGAAGAATLGLAGTASAAVTKADYNTTTQALVVEFDGNTNIDITCDPTDGIQINGDSPTRDGQIAGNTGCAAPTSLTVTEAAGADASANVVDLRGVTRASFTALATSAINTADGTDTIHGTEIGDTIDSGDENDTVNGNRGNDTMIWNPGDDSDVMNGDGGVDTVQDNDGNGDSTFVVKPKDGDPTRVDASRINAPFTLDIEAERLEVNGNGGIDNISGQVGVAGLTKVTMNGGEGNDVLVGTDGDDVQRGGPGSDSLTGARGNDDMAGDDGDDIMIWTPGDGSDKMEGGAGNDVAQDNGGNAPEHFVISANGQRVTATRDSGAPFFLDIGTSETLDLNANGGNDTVDVNGGLAALIKVDADLGDGDDSIKARNDSSELIEGGGGNDAAQVDLTDVLSNVEAIDAPVVAPPPPPAADEKAPKAAIKSRRLNVDGGRAAVRFTVPADEDQVDARIRILRGGKIVGSLKLADLEGGDTRTARVQLNRKTRIALAKAQGKKLRATVKVQLTDAAGNKATASQQLNLKG
jgi:Ca2+-binding RTX toxin-like protein